MNIYIFRCCLGRTDNSKEFKERIQSIPRGERQREPRKVYKRGED